MFDPDKALIESVITYCTQKHEELLREDMEHLAPNDKYHNYLLGQDVAYLKMIEWAKNMMESIGKTN